MWNPSSATVPDDVLQILRDEDDSDMEDNIMEEVEVDEDDRADDLNSQLLGHVLPGVNVFVMQADGILAPVTTRAKDPPDVAIDSDDDEEVEVATGRPNGDDDVAIDSDDEEEVEVATGRPNGDDDVMDDDAAAEREVELARARVLRAISPITPCPSPGPSVTGGGDAREPRLSTQPGRRATNRRSGRGGRGRGRGRGRGLTRGGMSGRSVWSQGQRLIQRFSTDEELPSHLRQEYERLTEERRRRTRPGRRVNVEEEESEDESVSDMHNEEFTWMGMNDWNGRKEDFVPGNPGPTRIFTCIYDAFRSYWDDNLLAHIVTETNRYAHTIVSERFRRDWYDTNLDEILILFVFYMMLGIIHVPTIKSCWSKMTALRTDIFRTLFTEDRFWHLNRALHFANGSADSNDPTNVLYPMGPLLDELNIKFKQNYILHQDICIDESLTLWKGPVKFRQYIKTKSARYGIKTYQLCESSTGYLWSFFVYVGANTTGSTVPSSVSTVLKLVQPLYNLGHVLYMDNWFNSPGLARYLKRRGTDCVGTLRPNRKHVPAVIQRAPLVEAEFVARQSGDVMIVALHDRKRLTCISTYHDVTQILKTAKPGHPAHYKLQLIDDYNQGMGGVDRLDQMLESYLIERKQCIKWTRKFFKRLINITIQNARILVEQSTHTKIPALAMRLTLVNSLIEHHRHKVPTRNPNRPPPRSQSLKYSEFPAERLTERHFLSRIKITSEMRASVRHASNLGRRQCVWCAANGQRCRKTVNECRFCKVALCSEPCFEQFHTIP